MFAGSVGGFLPMVVALFRKKVATGFGLFFLCIVAGFLGGLPYAIPAGVVALLIAIFVRTELAGCGMVAVALLLTLGIGITLKWDEIVDAVEKAQERTQKQKASLQDETIDFRTFTSSDGKKIEARIEDFDGMNVTLFRSDGKTFTISISRFSINDQVFIRRNYR